MRLTLCSLALALASMAPIAQAACYTVYGKDGSMIYRDQVTPVDLGRPVGDAVPERFGTGASMVFSATDLDCLPFAAAGVQAPPTASQAAEMVASAYEANILASLNDAPPALAGLPGGYGTSSLSGGGYRGAQGPIQTGPRGGRFYINSGGNKTYVKRR
ncbi:hypothetical protein [Acidovorax sp. SDU_ACID1]|uniref:hypothetical protein n=1 Tax=Acidovorax sp. SDU_ACID1 TaxID=3136632 RepID=UPI00387349B6